jgi:hypothetical protein
MKSIDQREGTLNSDCEKDDSYGTTGASGVVSDLGTEPARLTHGHRRARRPTVRSRHVGWLVVAATAVSLVMILGSASNAINSSALASEDVAASHAVPPASTVSPPATVRPGTGGAAHPSTSITGSVSGTALSYPSITYTAASCFGGGTCTSTTPGSTDGYGTVCETPYSETDGDFLVVAISYNVGSDIISYVNDGGWDSFEYVGGVYANSQSVAIYVVQSEFGGAVNVNVGLSSAAYGNCLVGQLPAGTQIGWSQPGTSESGGTSLSVSNEADHEPSLVLALFGSTRATGPWVPSGNGGAWIIGSQQLSGNIPGDILQLMGLNVTTWGTVTITESIEWANSMSAIAVEFYQGIPTEQGAGPVSACFGGANPCTGSTDGTTAGEGTSCVISSYYETQYDFLYLVVAYRGGSNVISSVSDGGLDNFHLVDWYFANLESVAVYDVDAAHGGTVTITVTLSTSEYGSCQIGELTAGTAVGSVGTAGGTADGTGLSVSNNAPHYPSLLMGFFGSTRATGPWVQVSPYGDWIAGGQQLTGDIPGNILQVMAYNATTSGGATIEESIEWANSMSAIAVEFYLQSFLSGGFSGSGNYPLWGDCEQYVSGTGYVDPTTISFSLSFLIFDTQGNLRAQTEWDSIYTGTSGFNYNTWCGTTSDSGSVTWGSTFTCSDGSQGLALSWNPSFTQTWYLFPYIPYQTNVATYNVLIYICGGGSVTLYITYGSSVIVDWVSIAEALFEFSLD